MSCRNFIYILFLFLSFKAAAIVGGKPATWDAPAWTVSFRNNGKHYCSGSLISDRHILSSKHCLGGASSAQSFSAVAGGDGLRATQVPLGMVNRVYFPPGITAAGTKDVVVYGLANPIANIEGVNPIDILDDQFFYPSSTELESGRVTAYGWGADVIHPVGHLVLPKYLKKITLSALRTSFTIFELFPLNDSRGFEAPLLYFETAEADGSICDGDSGGPLVVERDGKYIQFGLAKETGDVPCINVTFQNFENLVPISSWLQGVLKGTVQPNYSF